MTWTKSRVAAALVLAVLLAVACSSGDDDAEREPRPPDAETSSTTIVDYSGVLLAPVRGETTTTVRTTGRMVIRGSVQGPGGPVPGAIVRIERLVRAEPVLVTDVAADASGGYELAGIPGGRYRIRAFQPPGLVQLEPVVDFLRERDQHEIDLTVEPVGGLEVRAAAAPDPPTVDNPVNVVVQVTVRQVDADGIVRGAPQTDVPVELSGFGAWVPRQRATTTSTGGTSTPTTGNRSGTAPRSLTAHTDASGRARFELRCERGDAPGLLATLPVITTHPDGSQTASSQTFDLDLPACVDLSASTTTTTTGPSTTSTPSTAAPSTTEPSTTAPSTTAPSTTAAPAG